MTTSSDLMADSNNVASLCSRRVSVVGVMSLPQVGNVVVVVKFQVACA